MGKTKTLDDYEYDIEKLTRRIELETDETRIHAYNRMLYTRLIAWFELTKHNVIINVANNEKMPWTEDEIGYKITEMPTKKECGFDQVADYHITMHGITAGLIVERKGCEWEIDDRGCVNACGNDLYTTLIHNHSRFNREIARFKSDSRFETMIVITECTYAEYMRFRPPFHINKRSDGEGASIESRIGTLNAMMTKYNINVLFAGSRMAATSAFNNIVKQAIMRDYKKFIVGITE